MFAWIVRHLFALDVVARVDEGALARYADLYVQYRRASEFLARHGDVYVVPGRPGKDGKPPLVTLRADRALDYGRVMSVMGELNRAGFNSISLVTSAAGGGGAVSGGSERGQ